MALYKTGQIHLTNGSAIVTGIGTAWKTALIAGGIVMPAVAGNSLPIDAVDSDTQITAAVTWAGATGTYNYALSPVSADEEQADENRARLTELLVRLNAGTIFKYDMFGPPAGRDAYDSRPKGFSYLSIYEDGADWVSELYVKASATDGDWSGPLLYGVGPRGIPGPVSAVEFQPVATGAAGSNATMVITGSGTAEDPFLVTFTIPRGSPGPGDVDGPSSAVNNRVVVFDGTTGKMIKDSGIILGDAASKNTGTAAGTLAAGDDSRFSNNAKLNVEDQTLTGGARVTSKDLGTLSTGTLTLDPGDRPLQHYTNNGAHTLAPGSNTGSFLLDITNGASAGAITLTGWTKVAGDAFTTTSGNKFRCHASIGSGGSVLIVQAMQ